MARLVIVRFEPDRKTHGLIKGAMRFHPTGPAIPSRLLEARDQGEVVFLCGAGVSMPAGLPDFRTLAREVIADLGVPPGDDSRVLLEQALDPEARYAPPMDQVFGILKRDYSAALVEETVARRLNPGPSPDLEIHRTILALSTDVEGRRRLVTTNFDPLFEKADRRLKVFVPPSLPELQFGQGLTGITYLHGRLPTGRRKGGAHGLILGAADFGRAYLADGWAARFMRQLMDRYIVVLLGYSADDPPVRYLLEGVNAISTGEETRLYAFAEGDPEQVGGRWRDRGVEAIAYPKSDKHAALWDSLAAWRERATDPVAWATGVVEMAAAGPRALEPHQRGQVAALVSSATGARAFAAHKPPPPAEWVCVLDAGVRYARPKARYAHMADDEERFDPLEAWGLDDDPPRPEERGAAAPGQDYLSLMPGDEVGSLSARLGGAYATLPELLPARLQHLAVWLSSVASQPAVLWWASGKGGLHPSLQRTIEIELGPRGRGAEAVRAAWRLLREVYDEPQNSHQLAWYEVRERLQNEGWTPPNLRRLQRLVRPRLKATRPGYPHPRPPAEADSPGSIVSFDVEFPELHDRLEPPDDSLAAVTAIYREALVYGAALLTDIGHDFQSTPSLHPDPQNRGELHPGDEAAFFLSFARLFTRLVQLDPQRARAEMLNWPYDQPIFFQKLHTWALMQPAISRVDDVAAFFLDLPRERLWHVDGERELLWTLKARWAELSEPLRRRLEKRLVAGPERWPEEKAGAYRRRRAVRAGTRIGWLHRNGCQMSPSTMAALERFRSSDPAWRPAWEEEADDEGPRGVYSITHDTNPQGLLGIPLGEVLAAAEQASKREWASHTQRDPFAGLVAQYPRRAIAALGWQARKGFYPPAYWSSLLGSWPADAPPRLWRLTVGRLLCAPNDILVECRFALARWIEGRLAALLDLDPAAGWRLWDRLLEAFVEGGDEALRSAIGDPVFLDEPRPSRRTYDHACNAPAGILTEALFKLLSARRPTAESGLSGDVRQRFERLLAAPGEGGDYAASVLCNRLAYLAAIDQAWVVRTLVPLFEPEHPRAEPAWSGYLWRGRLVRREVFDLIKPAFLRVFSVAASWRWGERPGSRLSEFLIAEVMSGRKDRLVSLAEARHALQIATHDAREKALSALRSRMKGRNGWRDARLFLTEAWPKEMRLQSSATARRMADIAMSAGEAFPQAVELVAPFLRPVADLDLFTLHMAREGRANERPLATRYPAASLRLLDLLIPASGRLPYDLGEALDLIQAADPALQRDQRMRRLRSRQARG